MRPQRCADSGKAKVVASAKKAFWSNLEELDGLLKGREWLIGSQTSVADGYARVFYGGGARSEYRVKQLPHYTA